MAKGDKRPVVMGAEKGQAWGVATLGEDQRLVQEQLTLHAGRHRVGGTDPLAPADIGAAGGKNLLMNCDFGIWQRYPGGVFQGAPDNIYIADRFQVQSCDRGQTSKLVRVAGGGIRNQAGPGCALRYYMEGAAAYNGREMTLSVLRQLPGGVGGLTTATIVPSGWTDGTDVLAAFSTYENGLNWLHEGAVIYRYKLEVGSQQTLARQTASGLWVLNDPAPDPAAELAKCQRYQQVLRSTSGWFMAAVGSRYPQAQSCRMLMSLPVSMAKTPAVVVQGQMALMSGTEGIDTALWPKVTAIAPDNLTANTLSLSVTVDRELAAGTPYYLWAIQGDGEKQIILDANL